MTLKEPAGACEEQQQEVPDQKTERDPQHDLGAFSHFSSIAALAAWPSCLFPDFSGKRPRKPFVGLTQWITSSNTRRAQTVRDSRCLRASPRGLGALRASSSCLFPDFSGAGSLA